MTTNPAPTPAVGMTYALADNPHVMAKITRNIAGQAASHVAYIDSHGAAGFGVVEHARLRPVR